jgi:hypothetical protein
MRTRPAQGMAETLCACPPTRGAAKLLPYSRTSCSGRTAAVGHSMFRRPIELLAAPAPSASGANTSRNRPRSKAGPTMAWALKLAGSPLMQRPQGYGD